VTEQTGRSDLVRARERIKALQAALEEAAPDWLPENLSAKADVIEERSMEIAMRLLIARKALEVDQRENGLCDH